MGKKSFSLKWLLVGCGCTILLTVCIIAFAALIFGLVMGIIKNSEPYKMSIQLVETSPAVKEEIGTIKSYGWFTGGNINTSGTTWEANLSISMTGEKGNGLLETRLVKKFNKWEFQRAEFCNKSNGKRIDLLTKSE